MLSIPLLLSNHFSSIPFFNNLSEDDNDTMRKNWNVELVKMQTKLFGHHDKF